MRLVQAAAWHSPGSLTFEVGSSTQTGHVAASEGAGGVTVRAVTLDGVADELKLGRIDFIKMDIEGAEKQALKAKQCNTPATQHHLARLQSTASDIVPVFGIDEKTFTDDATQLQTRLQQAVQAAPATCEALAAAIQPVGETCKSCHQQYR